MSKFIKVTDLEHGWSVMIFTHRIAGIIPHHQSGSVITGVDGKNIEVVESLEQIEAQLLRDEFAKAALGGILANSSIDNLEAKDVSHDSFIFADAMLKERTK